MLIISYGIPKTGSTLAFELARGLLINVGFAQDLHYDDKPGPSGERGTKRGFLKTATRERIEELIAQIGPERRIVIKTHAGFEPDMFAWLEERQQRRDIQVIASYRDPRDIALSVLDAGERARARLLVKPDSPKAFSHVQDLEHAAKNIAVRIVHFRRWAALKGSLRVDYEDVAFEPVKAIDAMERALGVVCNREEVLHYAFEEAFTLKNKAKRHRYLDEMDDAQKKMMRRIFRNFIKNVCEESNQEWFDVYREKMLRGG
jgi:hypothetical protein